MNQAELFTALKSLGMPVAYLAFQSPVQAPFITYHYAYSSDMMADNQNYLDIGNFQVELYATKRILLLKSWCRTSSRNYRCHIPKQKHGSKMKSYFKSYMKFN